MKDFCIVRAKINPETGRPLISLPSKTEKLVSITLTPHERLIYDHVRGMSFSCYLTKLMRLRQGIHSIAVYILYLTMLWSSMWPHRPSYRGIIYWKPHDWRGYNCRPASQVRHLLLASFDNSWHFYRLEDGRSSKAISIRSLPPDLHNSRRLFKDTYLSSKLSAALTILKNRAPGEKTLIFVSTRC